LLKAGFRGEAIATVWARRKGGWPSLPALAAAAALHACVLAFLMVDWLPRPAPAAETALPVRLVQIEAPKRDTFSTPPLVPPAVEATPERAAAEAGAAATEPAWAAAPAEQGAAPMAPERQEAAAEPPPLQRPDPPPNVTGEERGEHPAHHAATAPPRQKPTARRAKKPHAPPLDGVAVYNVVLDAGGSIRAVNLVQSSGNAAFDQAGERMIRASMHFPPPAPSEAAYFAVSLRFTPEAR
jgi:TonB family protein